MSDLEPLISAYQIQQAISDIVPILHSEYKDKDPVFIAILKGSICFVSDLIKQLSFPLTLEFVQIKSYKGKVAGQVTIKELDFSIKNKHVLIIDDILDRGETLSQLVNLLQKQCPLSLKSLVLLKKKTSQKAIMTPDFSLLDIEDHFVVGYGLDYNEHYRNLNGIYSFKRSH